MWKTNNFVNEEKEGWQIRKRRLTLSSSKIQNREITLKYNGDIYCLSCLHPFRMENKFESYGKVCKDKDFCGIEMPSEKNNILEFNQ